jgi:hypothetical protein
MATLLWFEFGLAGAMMPRDATGTVFVPQKSLGRSDALIATQRGGRGVRDARTIVSALHVS